MQKQYAIFQLSGGYTLEPARGFVDKDWSEGSTFLPNVRFNSEDEALKALETAFDLTENVEYVVLPVYTLIDKEN